MDWSEIEAGIKILFIAATWVGIMIASVRFVKSH